jgi:hypothetical protein
VNERDNLAKKVYVFIFVLKFLQTMLSTISFLSSTGISPSKILQPISPISRNSCPHIECFHPRGAIREEFVDPGSRFNPGFLG